MYVMLNEYILILVDVKLVMFYGLKIYGYRNILWEKLQSLMYVYCFSFMLLSMENYKVFVDFI